MKASLNSMHHQGGDWLRELEFYKEEIAILTGRLEEVISKNTHQGVTSEVEHFQNKFIVLRESIDTLNHDVNAREKKIEEISKTRPEHITEHFTTGKDGVLIRMKDFAKEFADTRYEFNTFLAKTL